MINHLDETRAPAESGLYGHGPNPPRTVALKAGDCMHSRTHVHPHASHTCPDDGMEGSIVHFGYNCHNCSSWTDRHRRNFRKGDKARPNHLYHTCDTYEKTHNGGNDTQHSSLPLKPGKSYHFGSTHSTHSISSISNICNISSTSQTTETLHSLHVTPNLTRQSVPTSPALKAQTGSDPKWLKKLLLQAANYHYQLQPKWNANFVTKMSNLVFRFDSNYTRNFDYLLRKVVITWLQRSVHAADASKLDAVPELPPEVWHMISEFIFDLDYEQRYFFHFVCVMNESKILYIIPFVLGYIEMLCVLMLLVLETIDYEEMEFLTQILMILLFCCLLTHIIGIVSNYWINASGTHREGYLKIKNELFCNLTHYTPRSEKYRFVALHSLESIDINAGESAATCSKKLKQQQESLVNHALANDWKEEHDQCKHWDLLLPAQKWSNVFEICIVDTHATSCVELLSLLLMKYVLLLVVLIIFACLRLESREWAWLSMAILLYAALACFAVFTIVHFVSGRACLVLPTWDSFLLIASLCMGLFVITFCYVSATDKDLVVDIFVNLVGPIGLYGFLVFFKSLELKHIKLGRARKTNTADAAEGAGGAEGPKGTEGTVGLAAEYPVLFAKDSSSWCGCTWLNAVVDPPRAIKLH